jgi:hypothetical protein
MKFTIRDLLLITVIIAILAGWWVDRSKLAWSYSQTLASADRLRSLLDDADPGWRNRPVRDPIVMKFAGVSPVGGYAIGVGIVATCLLMIVLVWKGYLHPSILEERKRF